MVPAEVQPRLASSDDPGSTGGKETMMRYGLTTDAADPAHTQVFETVDELKASLDESAVGYQAEVLVEIVSGGRTVASSLAMKADVLVWDPRCSFLPRPAA